MILHPEHAPLSFACLHSGKAIGLSDKLANDELLVGHLAYQFGAFITKEFEKPSFESLRITKVESVGNIERVRQAICFGAGIDSTVLGFKMNNLCVDPKDLCFVFIDYNGPWSDKEAKQARRVYDQVLAKHLPGCSYLHLKLDHKPSNLIKGYILPGRNGMLMELALSYLYSVGANVYSCMLAANYKKDDTSGAIDKGRVFFGQMTDMMSKKFGKMIQCWSPVLHESKLEALIGFKHPDKIQVIQDILTHTTSCYDGEDQACGKCYACFKRNLVIHTLKYGSTGMFHLDWSKIPHIDLEGELPEVYREYIQREKAKGRKFSYAVEEAFAKHLANA